ncbi:23S rRNA (adenine(2030)-N(6))-methyltransferase RlmJ [Rheinheimera sp. MMS21-TC3]|uniref:23S rRNA (adenine(2030)-N(6))-methyltransferase RlmJ n=1 Tax=Rheinheimera sp. MMS21-TC3 TaxID=3072790 RepID=UPI0028C4F4A9|nr:23S rRNA (adenine(2030)-N(6))-methyltransferase RlmJ [Rheinheimera sp. MMS21-TC3]WNO60775.1 23S rRNA (adenine(2030)-N(6))-methyltransferase RlmJ [Rheinheimera sp. MMS21-TC3]
MLSYRHSYHAGNHADVIKHLVQVAIIDYLLKKDKPFCYHDSHAGAGLYSLASEQALKTAEYETGIGKLWQHQPVSPALQSYLKVVKALNSDNELSFYPGSPKIAELMLRPNDSIQATELHPTDYPILASQFTRRRYSRIEKQDAWAGFKAMLPPLHKRGLVLIDPPYELKHEYEDVVAGLKLAYQRFPQATYAIWYPVIERASVEAFIRELVNTGIKNQLRIELCPLADTNSYGMTGSGMLVINPPYTLADTMRQALTEIQPLVAPNGDWQVHQLVLE